MSVVDPGAARQTRTGNLPNDIKLKRPEDADKYMSIDQLVAIATAMGFPPQSVETFRRQSKGKPSAFLKAMPNLNMKRVNLIAHEQFNDTPREYGITDELFDDYTNIDKIRFAKLLNDRKSNPVVWNYLRGLAVRGHSLPTLQKIIGKARDDNNIVNIVAASQEAGIDAPQVDEVLTTLNLGTTTQDVARQRGQKPPTMPGEPGAGAAMGAVTGAIVGAAGQVKGEGGRGAPVTDDSRFLGEDTFGLDSGGLGGGYGDTLGPFGEPVPTDPAQVDDYIRRNFGYWSFLLDEPELKEIFRDLVAKKAPASEIQARVMGSRWFRTHTAAQQTWAALASTNPAEANTRIQKQAQTLVDATRRFGIEITPERLSRLAEDSLKYGWDQNQVMASLANEAKFTANKSNPIIAGLKKTAADYVLNFSDAALQEWGRKIISGETTEDEFKLFAADQAKSMYPGLANAIDRNVTVRAYADQYIQTASNTLEIPPDQINLADSKWRRALQYRDAKSGEMRAMTVAEWEDYIKTAPEYNFNKTKQAKKLASELAMTINTTFGKV